jgi:hypothetical protein
MKIKSIQYYLAFPMTTMPAAAAVALHSVIARV